MITKEQFETYEAVRQSGRTNMFDAATVVRLSRKVGGRQGALTKEALLEIMRNYRQLCHQWPDVRDLEATK